MSRVTSLPWHSVDDLTREPGWVEVPQDEQRRRIEAICAEEEWILDTAYGRWLDIPLSRTQLIVALEYPRWFSLQRLVRRTVVRGRLGTPACNGNRESLRTAFSRKSIVAWHFRSFGHKRERIERWSRRPDGPAVLRFTDARQAETWLAGLSGSA